MARLKNEKHTGPGIEPRFALAAGLFLLLHVVAAGALPERLWGAHHARYLSPWALAVGIAVLVPFAFSAPRHAFSRALVRIDSGIDARPALGLAILFPLLGAIFLVFRTQNLFLGDGYLITSFVRDPSKSGIGAAGYVSLSIHKAIYAAIHALGVDAGGAAPFRLTSAFAGVAIVLLARSLSREIAGRGAARAIVFASIVLSGGMLLFFGYVEYYPLMQAALLLYLFLAVRFLCGRGPLLLPTAALVLACLLHISAIVFAPTWLLLLGRGGFTRRKVVALLVPSLLLGAVGAWGIYRYTEEAYRGLRAFLPLFDKGIHAYTFFSKQHLLFVGNELLLILGGAVLIPLLASGGKKGAAARADDRETGRFLASAAACGLLPLLFVDPWIGPRDWDLMALPLYPLLVLFGHRLASRKTEPGAGRAFLFAGLCFLHTYPWVAAQQDRDRAVGMTVAMVVRDAHYANSTARAPKALGVLLSRAGYDDRATLLFEKAASNLANPQNLFNVGTSRAKQGDLPGAAAALEEAIRIAPGYHDAYSNLAWCCIQMNEPGRAEEVLDRLLEISPDHPRAHRFLGVARAQQGNFEGAIESFRSAIERDPGDGDAWARLGIAYRELGRRGEAMEALRRAIEINPGSEAAAEILAELEHEE
ncbi:MAG: tetratricopeptide repeat protein [Candidatus Latescibacterota bacterium]|nr:MAG: tetratricopeptide repeat protein [Candidatus Latescibacterota bacterium]